jgi:hypothetical protein
MFERRQIVIGMSTDGEKIQTNLPVAAVTGHACHTQMDARGSPLSFALFSHDTEVSDHASTTPQL